MKMKKVKGALVKNFAIPVIDEALGKIPAPVEVKGAWFAFKVAYGLFTDLYPEEGKSFLEEVRKHIYEIGVQLTQSVEFQQSLALTFETLLRTRDERKRNVIKAVFLNGYINAEDRQTFYLERFYRVSQEISIEALEHLYFIKTVILPRKGEIIKAKIATFNKGTNSDEWWYKLEYQRMPDSQVVQEWLNENFNINSPQIKVDEPDSKTDRANWEKWANIHGDKEREKSNIFSELAAELLSLGIFKSLNATYNGGHTLTDFGREYIKYVSTSVQQIEK